MQGQMVVKSQRVMAMLGIKLFLLLPSLWSLGFKLKQDVFNFSTGVGWVTYLLQVGQRIRRSPEAVVAVPAEDQDKTQEAEAEDKFVDKSEVLQFCIFWWGLKGQGTGE